MATNLSQWLLVKSRIVESEIQFQVNIYKVNPVELVRCRKLIVCSLVVTMQKTNCRPINLYVNQAKQVLLSAAKSFPDDIIVNRDDQYKQFYLIYA